MTLSSFQSPSDFSCSLLLSYHEHFLCLLSSDGKTLTVLALVLTPGLTKPNFYLLRCIYVGKMIIHVALFWEVYITLTVSC